MHEKLISKNYFVDRGGFEPPTLGSSNPRSTSWSYQSILSGGPEENRTLHILLAREYRRPLVHAGP